MPNLRLSPRTNRLLSLRARLRREEGASLLEFAFSLGIFLLTTIGIIVLCMALFTYEYVDFASREAVRWAAVRGSSCLNMPNCNANQADLTTYIQSLNYPIVNPNNLSVIATWYSVSYDPNTGAASWTACASGCNDPGDAVRVTVSYPFSFGIPFFGNFAPDVSSTSQMVISQ